MRKILLSVALAGGFIFSSIGQENITPCATTEMTQEMLNNMSAQERAIYDMQQEQYEQEIQSFVAAHHDEINSSDRPKTISYKIPIVFHIIHGNGPENIPMEQIEETVEQMNKDYQKLNEWANTVDEFHDIIADVEIEFVLARRKPNGDCFNGVTRTYTPNPEDGNANRVQLVKNEHGDFPGDQYLNVYVAKSIMDGAAGYTFKPNDSPSENYGGGKTMGNGIHVLHSYTGVSAGTANGIGKHTMTHEAGHWFNLDHLWGGSNEPGLSSNCNIDDGVADTPNTIGWTSCNLSGSTCDNTLDNVQNFMEYSYCSTMFTEGQKSRMHAALNNNTGGRNKIWSEANLEATGVNDEEILCAADFKVEVEEICLGTEVEFEDLSYFNPTGWEWEFEGASPATSTEQNPTVVYDTPGVHKVKLTVSNGETEISTTKEEYITVLPEAATLPFMEGFEDYDEIADAENWSVYNKGNNAAFEITSEASYTGDKSIKLRNFGQAKGNIDGFTSKPIDLSGVNNNDKVTLSFRYAYRKRSNNNSEWLKVFLSNDCGASWTQRKTLKGNSLSSEIAGSSWTPSSEEDWTTVHVTNVTSAFWVDNFRMRFEFESDAGNNIFIDDINIYEGSSEDEPTTVSVNDETQLFDFTVYPNPADEMVNVSFSAQQTEKATIELVNMMGQTVNTHTVQANSGQNIVMLDTESLNAGVYLVRLNIAGSQSIQRLIVE